MRSFYLFKLFQFVITFVLLSNLMTFDFCVKFVSPQCFLKSAVPTGRCQCFYILDEQFKEAPQCHAFSKDNLAATKNLFEKANATDDEKKYMDYVTSHLPTGDRCVPLRISFVTSINNSYYGIKSVPLDYIAKPLTHVQLSGFVFFGMILLHVMIQQYSGFKPNFYGYMCIACSVIIWVYSSAIAAWMSFEWTARWECTNFVPNSSPVLLTVLILSFVLLCSSLFELLLFFGLLKLVANHAKTTANKCSANVKEVVVKANVKNGELSDVSVIKKANCV